MLTPYGECRPAVEFAFLVLGYGCRCMEVGVQNGDHARIMLHVLRPSRFVAVDPWCDLDWSWKNEVYTTESFSKALKLLAEYKVEYVVDRSQSALPNMSADSFDFIYIDGDHSADMCVQDIRNSLRLVRVGGIVGGHDYGLETMVMDDQPGYACVAAAVQEVFQGRGVFGIRGDWWVVVTPEMKRIA